MDKAHTAAERMKIGEGMEKKRNPGRYRSRRERMGGEKEEAMELVIVSSRKGNQ